MPDRARLRAEAQQLYERRMHAPNGPTIREDNRINGILTIDLPGLLDALDEAEKERDAAQTAHGELFTTFTETAARLDEAEKALARIRAVVDAQAEDDGLWRIHPLGVQPIVEAYLQQELRRLHAAVEGVTQDQAARIGAGE